MEGLTAKLENGEDGLYNLMTNDKNVIFAPNISITEKDIEEIPGLKELCESMDIVAAHVPKAFGNNAYKLKQQVLEMRQQQFILQELTRNP